MAKKEVNFLEEEVDDPTQVSVEEAVSRVNKAQKDLDMWRDELAPMLDIFWAAESELKKSKEFLTQVMYHRGLKFTEDSDFEFQITQKDDGWYDPVVFPDDAKKYPGIVKTVIDKKAVAAAIKRGQVDEDEARAAWVPKLSKPSVRVKIKTGES